MGNKKLSYLKMMICILVILSLTLGCSALDGPLPRKPRTGNPQNLRGRRRKKDRANRLPRIRHKSPSFRKSWVPARARNQISRSSSRMKIASRR